MKDPSVCPAGDDTCSPRITWLGVNAAVSCNDDRCKLNNNEALRNLIFKYFSTTKLCIVKLMNWTQSKIPLNIGDCLEVLLMAVM